MIRSSISSDISLSIMRQHLDALLHPRHILDCAADFRAFNDLIRLGYLKPQISPLFFLCARSLNKKCGGKNLFCDKPVRQFHEKLTPTSHHTQKILLLALFYNILISLDPKFCLFAFTYIKSRNYYMIPMYTADLVPDSKLELASHPAIASAALEAA